MSNSSAHSAGKEIVKNMLQAKPSNDDVVSAEGFNETRKFVHWGSPIILSSESGSESEHEQPTDQVDETFIVDEDQQSEDSEEEEHNSISSVEELTVVFSPPKIAPTCTTTNNQKRAAGKGKRTVSNTRVIAAAPIDGK
jgi:hypothetical protein